MSTIVTKRQGWFAEKLEPDDPHYSPDSPWVATLQLDGYMASFDGPWFQTREDCEQFIRDEVVGQGVLPPR